MLVNYAPALPARGGPARTAVSFAMVIIQYRQSKTDSGGSYSGRALGCLISCGPPTIDHFVPGVSGRDRPSTGASAFLVRRTWAAGDRAGPDPPPGREDHTTAPLDRIFRTSSITARIAKLPRPSFAKNLRSFHSGAIRSWKTSTLLE